MEVVLGGISFAYVVHMRVLKGFLNQKVPLDPINGMQLVMYQQQRKY
jgi:hypothetical protein